MLLLFVYPPYSLSFTTDVYYIETVIADSILFLDTFKFNAFAGVYTKNLLFESPGLGLPTVNSSEQLIAQAYKLFPPGIVLQNAITTQRIAFANSTGEDYTFTEAKAIIYLTSTVFGIGNLTGQVVIVYSRLDDTLVKTSLPGYGGWRISIRSQSAFVSFSLDFPPHFRSCQLSVQVAYEKFPYCLTSDREPLGILPYSLPV